MTNAKKYAIIYCIDKRLKSIESVSRCYCTLKVTLKHFKVTLKHFKVNYFKDNYFKVTLKHFKNFKDTLKSAKHIGLL